MSEKKIIIVVESGGRERHYNADAWEPGDQYGLDVKRDSRTDDPVVAVYAPGSWQSVREGDALVPDSTSCALGIAKRGLAGIRDKIRATNTDAFGQANAVLAELRQLADDTLSEIWAETES